MRENLVDAVMVPLGMVIMVVYHVQLLYRVLYHPSTTVVGVNHMNRRAWVNAIMADGIKNGVLAVQTMRNHIMASTLLATAAITLCSILAIIMSGAAWNSNTLNKGIFLGNKTSTVSSLKLLCVITCFLVAFLCNVQSIRYYSHVSFLIAIPCDTTTLTNEYVHRALQRGSDFWSLGLRAFYFSFPLFLWIFGPMPMFACSLVLVGLLHFLDTAKEFNNTLHSSHVSHC